MASMRFGAELDHDGVTFRLWAPAARRVDVMLDRAHPMQAQPEGWYEVMVPGARAGTLYKYRIDGEHEVPDPASHYQPEDVFGPSEVIGHGQFRWRTNEWRGRPWADAVLLELHVGTFTPGGTFRAAIEKLDHLVETGITAIELMPIADFAGQRNWGYEAGRDQRFDLCADQEPITEVDVSRPGPPPCPAALRAPAAAAAL
jgi:maltooligosyltrehalose trehalohydrolase